MQPGGLGAEQLIFQRPQGENTEDDAKDRELDVIALPATGAEESGCPLAVRREYPHCDQVQDRAEAGPGDQLARPFVRQPVTDHWQRESRVEELAVRGDQGEEQRAESDEDKPV